MYSNKLKKKSTPKLVRRDGPRNPTSRTLSISKPSSRRPSAYSHPPLSPYHTLPPRTATSADTESWRAPNCLSTCGSCTGTQSCGRSPRSSCQRGSWWQATLISISRAISMDSSRLDRAEDPARGWISPLRWCTWRWLVCFKGSSLRRRRMGLWIWRKGLVLLYLRRLRWKWLLHRVCLLISTKTR